MTVARRKVQASESVGAVTSTVVETGEAAVTSAAAQQFIQAGAVSRRSLAQALGVNSQTMAQTMNLLELALQLPSMDDDLCILAARPWTERSLCEVVAIPEDNSRPNARTAAVEYFLEVFVAKEVCEVFGARRPSAREVANLLVFYAENDAYPDWVYEGT
jgi:hypothetical protein